MAWRIWDRSTRSTTQTALGPISSGIASSSSRTSGGSTAPILASALRAARPRRASERCATQRVPNTSASISSVLNISGGSMKPGLST